MATKWQICSICWEIMLPERHYSPRNRNTSDLPATSVESSTCFDFFRSFSFNFTFPSFSFFFSFSTSFSFSLASFSLDFSLFSFLLGNLNGLDFFDFEGLLHTFTNFTLTFSYKKNLLPLPMADSIQNRWHWINHNINESHVLNRTTGCTMASYVLHCLFYCIIPFIHCFIWNKIPQIRIIHMYHEQIIQSDWFHQ